MIWKVWVHRPVTGWHGGGASPIRGTPYRTGTVGVDTFHLRWDGHVKPSASSGNPEASQGRPAPKPSAAGGLPLAVRWVLITVSGYAAGLVASALDVPAPYLLAPLVFGVMLALCGAIPGRIPGQVNRCSQMLIGALMGSYLTPAALMAAAPLALPLTAVTAATVVLSLVVGLGLARAGRISRPSALLGLVPGGSAAIVSCADELKADARLVAFTQYCRVGLVATTAPLIAHGLASATRSVGSGSGGGPRPWPLVAGSHQAAGLLALTAVCIAGLCAGRRLRLPTPALIGPMLMALAAMMTGVVPGFAPSGALQNLAFVLVGLDVGVRFTRQTLRQMRRLLPAILTAVAAVCLACAALAWAFAATIHLPLIDAYLATTPGGINAVLATAAATHAAVALVSTVQSLRLLLVVLVTPILIRLIAPRVRKTRAR
jgi:membrane AbrB-like protein